MQIELESNRKHIKNIMLIGAIACFIGIVLLVLFFIFDNDSNGFVTLIIFFIFLGTIFVSVFCVLKYKTKPKFIFNEFEIFVNKKNKNYKISVENIMSMSYSRASFLNYFFTLIGFGETIQVIYIKEKSGEQHYLGFINLKDANRLKKIYKDLLEIS